MGREIKADLLAEQDTVSRVRRLKNRRGGRKELVACCLYVEGKAHRQSRSLNVRNKRRDKQIKDSIITMPRSKKAIDFVLQKTP